MKFYLVSVNISFLKELKPSFIIKVIRSLNVYVVSKTNTIHSIEVTFRLPAMDNTPNKLISEIEKIIVDSFIF